MTRLLIRFNWRECCFQRFQSWSCPVTGHTAYSTYTTYSKLFQPLQFFFSCFILLCLVVSFYFLLIHVPNVLLPSCVPPKPGFPWYLSHISLISTALFLVSLNLQLTPSLVGMRCSFLSAFVFGLPDLDHKTSPFVCCVACYWTNQLWDINPPSLYLTCILSL